VLTVYLLWCLAGLVLLARSADVLVVNSSALAERLGVPAVVVGVVVIGFGTSTPELLVSGLAATAGSAQIGIGNIVGSNIANLSLVLGIAALVAPVGVHVRVVRREVPMTVLATVVFALAVQGGITRAEAAGMLVLLAGCLTLLLRWSVDERAEQEGDRTFAGEVEEFLEDEQGRPLRRLAGGASLGLLGTLAGGQALVWGAIGLARGAGLSEGFVGVSIVAVGTSLPELVTAAQASRRGESDLIVGNLLGSNLFNALAVGGVVGLILPEASAGPALAVTGVLIMLAVSALALGFMVRRFQVVRWEAAVLVAVFVGCLPLMAGR
jgi:cation:H+ antiporter